MLVYQRVKHKWLMSNLAREHERSWKEIWGFEPLESSHLVGQDNPKKTQKTTQQQGSQRSITRALTKGQLRNRGLEFSHFWLDLWPGQPGHPGHYQVLRTSWDVNCSKFWWRPQAAWIPAAKWMTRYGKLMVPVGVIPQQETSVQILPNFVGRSAHVASPLQKTRVTFASFFVRVEQPCSCLPELQIICFVVDHFLSKNRPLVKIKIAGSCGCSSPNKIMIFDHSMDIQNNLITQ